MRVIAGSARGFKLLSVPGDSTRPITDRAKEALFSILGDWIYDTRVLDLFGGTGSISYELASRGTKDITIIEKDQAMYEFIKRTSKELKLENFKLLRMDVFKFILQCEEKFDLIFAGPPYALTNIDDLPELVFKKQLLNKKGWFILEHIPKNDYQKSPFYATERNYGTTIFSIFIQP